LDGGVNTGFASVSDLEDDISGWVEVHVWWYELCGSWVEVVVASFFFRDGLQLEVPRRGGRASGLVGDWGIVEREAGGGSGVDDEAIDRIPGSSGGLVSSGGGNPAAENEDASRAVAATEGDVELSGTAIGGGEVEGGLVESGGLGEVACDGPCGCDGELAPGNGDLELREGFLNGDPR